MMDTLRKSMSSSFVASLHELAPVAFVPEDIDLGDFAFVPFVRTGLAAAIRKPPVGNRAVVKADVEIADSADPSAHRTVSRDLTLYGPGDVIGLDPAEIIRRHPAPMSDDAERGDFAHVEFARPDLPWIFSPLPADGDRCDPWLALVVVEAAVSHVEPARDDGPAQLWTKKGQLQPLAENWRFAHAQVVGAAIDPAGPRLRGAAADTVETRLSDAHGAANLSRILCPRRLEDGVNYIAALVPAFDCGLRAGLRLGGGTLAPAWTRTSGNADEDIVLPVYDSWRFRTAPGGNFRELAERIEGVPAPWAVGRRLIDVSRPGSDIPDLPAGDPAGVQVLKCALFAPAEAPEDAPQSEPWPVAHREALRLRVDQANLPDDDLPRVGVRLYARYQRGASRIGSIFGAAPFGPAAAHAADADWFTQLNTDPMLRIVAQLGAKVVQADQEALMQAAWAQVEGIRKANQAILWAGLAEMVNVSLSDRHLARLELGDLLQVTRSLHVKLREGGQPRTIHAAVTESRTAGSTMSVAFRRALRPGGTLAARLTAAPMGRAVAGSQGLADHRLTHRQPDGISSVSKAGMQFFTDRALQKVLKAEPDRARTLLDQQLSTLNQTGGALRQLSTIRWTGADGLKAGEMLAAGLVEVVTSQLDRITPIAAQPKAAGLAEGLGELLVGLSGGGGRVSGPARSQLDRVGRLSPRADLQRSAAMSLGSTAPATSILTGRTGVERRPDLRGLGGISIPSRRPGMGTGPVIIDRPDRPQIPVETEPAIRFETELSRGLRRALEGLNVISAVSLRQGLADMVANIAVPQPIQTDLGPLGIGKAAVLEQIEPHMTARRALKGRLTMLPGIIRQDWIDIAGLRPIMAAPSFNRAMSKALEQYDRDWLVPGLGDIANRDFVTLLEINPAFAEAFLVGASDEMGRELLWRDYPTDQRGTYFKRFWDADEDELTGPIHRFSAEPVGRHFAIGGGTVTGGALALVVRGELLRRFPDTIIMAMRAESAAVPPRFIAGSEAPVLFHTHMAPDYTAVGFRLTAEDVRAGGNWWFLLAQNPTAPRFGLAEKATPETEQNMLDWADFGTVPEGGFLPMGRSFDVQDPGSRPSRVRWPGHAGVVARVLLKNPVRAAFRADKLLASIKP